jgi:hypothetical protein
MSNEPLPQYLAADALVGRLRGFDLDDDAEQLSLLAASATNDSLTPRGWELLGSLYYRAGRFAECATACERASQAEPKLATRFLAAYAKLRSHDATAHELLGTLLEEKEEGDDGPSLTTRHLAVADALWQRSDWNAAERAYTLALENDGEGRGEAWIELARLRSALGNQDGALAAIEQAIDADAAEAPARTLAARILTARGSLGAAAEQLRKAISCDPAQRALTASAPEFEPLRASAPELFEQDSKPDLSWLSRFPRIRELAASPELAGLPIEWESETDAEAGGESVKSYYAEGWHLGVLWNDKLWAECRKRSSGLLRVASLSSVRSRSGVELTGALYMDASNPEQLLFAAQDEIPPPLWLPVATTPAAVRAILEETYPARRKSRLELTQSYRAFAGYVSRTGVPSPYSGELEAATPHAMDRHWTFSPFVDPFTWGSASDEEPWPDRIPPQPAYMMKINARSRSVRAQKDGGISQFTVRTLWSRSWITIEYHRDDIRVLHVRYTPGRHRGVIRAYNELLSTDFPEDLPFDVAGAITGFELLSSEELETSAAEEGPPERLAAYLSAIAAVRHADLGVTGLLQRHLAHESRAVRGTIINLAIRYHWVFLLEELAITDQDSDIRGFLAGALDNGIAPPEFDDMGELVNGNAGDDDDQADDDHQEEGE